MLHLRIRIVSLKQELIHMRIWAVLKRGQAGIWWMSVRCEAGTWAPVHLNVSLGRPSTSSTEHHFPLVASTLNVFETQGTDIHLSLVLAHETGLSWAR